MSMSVPWPITAFLIMFIVVAARAFATAIFRHLKMCREEERQASKEDLAVSSNLNPVRIVIHDTPTIQRFFQDLDKEKPIRFKTDDIRAFTKNLSKEMGSGGFGRVFKGKLPDGIKIAVKVLHGTFDKNVEKEFMAEVGIIRRIHHKNLIRLYGYCLDTDKQMIALVYEYMENGSLDKFVFGKALKLEWSKLHESAIGTAKGISYLHKDCKEKIIHYDIKPSNILLDDNFVPKVADFGLTKLCSKDEYGHSAMGYRGKTQTKESMDIWKVQLIGFQETFGSSLRREN